MKDVADEARPAGHEPQDLLVDDLQTDTPRLLSSPGGAAMMASPISSWSQTPRRPQAGLAHPTSANLVSPICEGINTPLISCLTLQPGTWGCNAFTASSSQLSTSDSTTLGTSPLQPTRYHSLSPSSLQLPTAPLASSNNDSCTETPDAKEMQYQQLDQQLQTTETEHDQHMQQLQEATTPLQRQEHKLAQLLAKQATAQAQQGELCQVSSLRWLCSMVYCLAGVGCAVPYRLAGSLLGCAV